MVARHSGQIGFGFFTVLLAHECAAVTEIDEPAPLKKLIPHR